MLLDFIRFIIVPILFVVGLVATPYVLFGDSRVADIEKNAPEFLQSLGLEVIGMEGFTAGLVYQPGGCVWYVMRRKEEAQTLYNGCVSKWHTGKYELWNLTAVNAIKPR